MNVKKVNVSVKNVNEIHDIQFTRARIPYQILKTIIDKGKVAVVSGISRQNAYYIKKKLSKELGYRVTAIPARRDGEKVYLFMREDVYYLESLED